MSKKNQNKQSLDFVVSTINSIVGNDNWYGNVVVRIQAGNVSIVEVNRTLRPQSPPEG